MPDSLKYARVIPLFKKDDKIEVGNYRPVSILDIVSKVLERVVYDQLNDYLISKDLLFKYQSGFRSKFFTETCLIHLTDFIELVSGQCLMVMLFRRRLANTTVDNKDPRPRSVSL